MRNSSLHESRLCASGKDGRRWVERWTDEALHVGRAVQVSYVERVARSQQFVDQVSWIAADHRRWFERESTKDLRLKRL